MIIKKWGKGYLFECPECKLIARIDQEQAEGKVSIQCFHGCTYHETKNWIKDLEVKNMEKLVEFDEWGLNE